MREEVVKVKNLVKRFKLPGRKDEVCAVNDISFDICKEELVAFIGPNGAGKTTTLKCLSGLIYPSSGDVDVLGFKPSRREYDFLSRISLVMGQKSQLWWELPAKETFLLNKEIYQIDDEKYEDVLNDMIEVLNVGEIIKKPVRTLSLGERMRCELISSFLHSPELVFLDEPTIGLDIISQQNLRDFVKEYNKRYKASIILTSHNMEDVKDLCKRVIIIDKGVIVFDGKVSDLTRNYVKEKYIKFVLSSPASMDEVGKVGGKILEFTGSAGVLSVKRSSVADVCSSLLKSFKVEDLDIEEPSLEYVVKEVFEGRY